jgi:hypothetical protein
MSLAHGIEHELASFLNSEDLDIRASKEKTAAMSAKFTQASTYIQVCAQHGLVTTGNAVVIRTDALTTHNLQSAALECNGLQLLPNGSVLCTIPVIFRVP